MAGKTVRIRMLGNVGDFIVGKEYDIDIDRANQLSGWGSAVIVEQAATPAKEDKDGI